MSGRRALGTAGWAARSAALVLAAFAASVALPGAATDAGSRVPLPAVAVAAPGQCVEDVPTIRRNHMELLKHHRDRTVREGVRTTQHSLANCVSCHASKETGRVTGSSTAFCEGCHRYAAVKLDCFECHTDRALPAMAGATPVSQPAPGTKP